PSGVHDPAGSQASALVPDLEQAIGAEAAGSHRRPRADLRSGRDRVLAGGLPQPVGIADPVPRVDRPGPGPGGPQGRRARDRLGWSEPLRRDHERALELERRPEGPLAVLGPRDEEVADLPERQEPRPSVELLEPLDGPAGELDVRPGGELGAEPS